MDPPGPCTWKAVMIVSFRLSRTRTRSFTCPEHSRTGSTGPPVLFTAQNQNQKTFLRVRGTSGPPAGFYINSHHALLLLTVKLKSLVLGSAGGPPGGGPFPACSLEDQLGSRSLTWSRGRSRRSANSSRKPERRRSDGSPGDLLVVSMVALSV